MLAPFHKTPIELPKSGEYALHQPLPKPKHCATLGVVTAITLSALLVAGCAENSKTAINQPAINKTASNKAQEANKKWIGQHRDQLIAKLGQPNQIIGATILGRPPSEAFIYNPKNPKDCVDAFVVLEETGMIVDYFCR